jgi:hypothetical protein
VPTSVGMATAAVRHLIPATYLTQSARWRETW